MHRGEIWWADLRDPTGSEPGQRRPVLLVQADAFTRSRIRTVLAVALTGNLRLATAPGNVQLPRRETGLPKDSVANVSQVLTVDKAFLAECVGVLPRRYLDRVDFGLRLVLDL
jgi:mRNA interferase MazF